MISLFRTISSQRYIDDDIVEEKRNDGDYACSYIIVSVEGEEFRVLIDGHHSFAAAVADEIEPEWSHNLTIQQDVDALGSMEWLECHQHDSDWYDIDTGIDVW